MGAWRADGFSERPAGDLVLLATREHDNGWHEVDAAPAVNLEGEPYDFASLPDQVKQSIWPRGVTRLSRDQPAAAALVAQHALTVLQSNRSAPRWQAFFENLQQMRDRLIAENPTPWPGANERFFADYRIVYFGDLLSLIFCNGWRDPHETSSYRIRLDGDTLLITPDPFAGERVAVRARARRIPARRYRDDLELAEALEVAASVELAGIACGTDAV